MKKKLLTLVLCTLTVLSTVAQDELDYGKSLGLVAYLTSVKSFGEAKMISLATNAAYETQSDKVKTFNSSYNLLKLSADKLINQLSADLYSSNRLRLYKSLNAYLKNKDDLPAKFAHYKPLIDEIDGRLQVLLIKTYSGALAGASLEEITGAVELVHTVITDARDFREKKIQSVTALLKDLHLKDLIDLVKPKEKAEA